MAFFKKANLNRSETDANRPLLMLVDDEANNLAVLSGLLQAKYRIIIAENGQDALEKIYQLEDPRELQVIICDQRMPGLSGTQFFEKIVEQLPETKRIILTGYSDMEATIDAINKAKIYNYIRKPYEASEILLSVFRAVESFQLNKKVREYMRDLENKVQDRTLALEAKNRELEEKNKALNQALADLDKASLTDPLTGIHNRRFLTKFIPGELANIHRNYFNPGENPTPDLGFLLIDADHFKSVNDLYGHDAGDRVLKQLVHILQKSCRETDWIVRWGGEEFLIVSRFVNSQSLQHLAERICANVAAHSFDIGQGKTLSRTCSVGCVAYPFFSTTPGFLGWEQTVNLADMAMYAAKKSGRNGWIHLREREGEGHTEAYEAAVSDLGKAIENGRLTYLASTKFKNLTW